ncbi:hypothetical protein BpHYR1_021281 [Brachionus plicatilis]|uniref:Uncharacterized protein n=1 Tax=Brachionus plicatilis TaxID=10195 RepID=A0A3M7PL18_BRAPC|nr:hypothetical protein BpHYR1_021281 [Brachionus plicatilis]
MAASWLKSKIFCSLKKPSANPELNFLIYNQKDNQQKLLVFKVPSFSKNNALILFGLKSQLNDLSFIRTRGLFMRSALESDCEIQITKISESVS